MDNPLLSLLRATAVNVSFGTKTTSTTKKVNNNWHTSFTSPQKKGISQDELAKQLNTKGHAIGRYERDEMKPSIEAAAKMSQILSVSLDWPVGITDEELNTTTMTRVQDINKLPQKEKELVFELLDSFIVNKKIKKVLL